MPMRPTASRSPRCSCWPRSACSPAFCPVCSSTRYPPSRSQWSATQCRSSGRALACRSCRSPQSRSSYNGLLVFLFIAISGFGAAFVIHRFASHKLRRGPIWDCGYPDASPATQYTAVELRPADPPRVRDAGVPRPRDRDMPPPLDARPARLVVQLSRRDLGHALRTDRRIRRASSAERLNRLQFLSIRHYLGLVFASLVGLLLILAIWP